MNSLWIVFSFVLVAAAATQINDRQTPIVMWHGMGDSCCFPFSLGSIKKLLEEQIPGVYVKSLKIGGNLFTDYESGYFMHPNRQIMDVCSQIKADPKLSDGFHALGFSQGGQFLRGLVQRCDEARVWNLITLGAQHQGVFGLPSCSADHKFCEKLREILKTAAYSQVAQDHLVQATYWHDPLNEETYRSRSSFLANINNEYAINEDYVNNLNRIQTMVLVKFTNDTMVQPRESSWFGFYTSGQDSELQTLQENLVYDRLGLRQLDQDSKLVFLESEGNHLQFTKSWFIENILPYLK